LYKVSPTTLHIQHCSTKHVHASLPYLTLPPGWAGSYTCPALRPYQFAPMCIPECNHKVTGKGYKAIDGCKVVNRRL